MSKTQPKYLTRADECFSLLREKKTLLRTLEGKYNTSVKKLDEKHLPAIQQLKDDIMKLDIELKAIMAKHPAAFSEKVRSIPLVGGTLKATKTTHVEFLNEQSEEEIIQLIREHLPEFEDEFIITVETVSLEAVKKAHKETRVTAEELNNCSMAVVKDDSYSYQVNEEEMKSKGGTPKHKKTNKEAA